jgi:outer membrane protein assembly factor BamA
MGLVRVAIASAAFAITCSSALAQQPESGERAAVEGDDALTKFEKSPWLLAPVFQSNPKLGTSLGALAGYLHYYDEKSRPSIFAVTGQYTSTESIVAGAITKTSFDEDHQRVIAGLMYGNIKNDYDDYLGTGVPLRNNAELRSFIARYTYRIKDNWFVGAQGIYQNFAIGGVTAFDDQVLDILGVQPYKSAGAGLVVQNDSRDSENMPTRGWLLNINNMAFRESLGGDNDYDVYRVELRYYIEHGDGNVLALRQLNHLTNDAPAAARAPVQLRGYKIGQFTGQYMSSVEAEERFRLGEKWTATLFAGVACLYGSGENCTDSANVYPAGGAGIQYILKPKEGLVLNLEYAMGKNDDYGFYLKMGYAY